MPLGFPKDPRGDVPKVTTADLAFPASVRQWLPKWEDIPEDFKRRRGEAEAYCKFVSAWFFNGVSAEEWDQKWRLRDGVTFEDAKERTLQIKCILGSFEPKHEHKEAGAAYLLYLFTEAKA